MSLSILVDGKLVTVRNQHVNTFPIAAYLMVIIVGMVLLLILAFRVECLVTASSVITKDLPFE